MRLPCREACLLDVGLRRTRSSRIVTRPSGTALGTPVAQSITGLSLLADLIPLGLSNLLAVGPRQYYPSQVVVVFM
jgi:hypothetical protein